MIWNASNINLALSSYCFVTQNAPLSLRPEDVQQHRDAHRSRGLRHPQVPFKCVWNILSGFKNNFTVHICCYGIKTTGHWCTGIFLLQYSLSFVLSVNQTSSCLFFFQFGLLLFALQLPVEPPNDASSLLSQVGASHFCSFIRLTDYWTGNNMQYFFS